MDIDYSAIACKIVNDHATYCKGTDREHVSYEPCYFDQGYSDTDEEVMSAFVSGETDKYGMLRWRELAYDALGDWESDCIWHDAGELRDEYMKDADHGDDFDDDELRQEIVHALEDSRTQDVALEWVQNMRPPHIRVMLTDEDHPDSWVENDEDWTPERLATNAGIEHTEKNLKACQVILDNAYYPGTVKMLFLVFRMDIPKEMDGDKVRIKGGVELWATNPFTGDGMSDEVDVDMTIDRSMLRTDDDACGYSYDDVFCPHWPSIGRPELTFIKSKKEATA